ncbi:MAG: hypothetical protein WCH99_04365, partial [Verrucomicrobiota bacterium]
MAHAKAQRRKDKNMEMGAKGGDKLGMRKHSTLNIQRSTFNAQHSTLNIQQPTFNSQHSTANIQQPTFN